MVRAPCRSQGLSLSVAMACFFVPLFFCLGLFWFWFACLFACSARRVVGRIQMCAAWGGPFSYNVYIYIVVLILSETLLINMADDVI